MENSLFSLLNKKFILSILTSSVFITGFTTSVIWFYLSNINRLDVFFDAISITTSLGVIFGFTLLSLIGFSSLIFIASFMVIFIYTVNEHIYKEYNGIAHRIGSICYVNSLFICLTLVGGFSIHYYQKFDGRWITILGLIFIIIFSYCFTRWFILNAHIFFVQDIGKTTRFIRKKEMRFCLPLYLITPGIVQILPLMFLLTQLEFEENTNDFLQLALFFLMSAAFITVGILPGSIVINERENKREITKILWGGAIFLPVVLIVLSLLFRPIPNFIINMAMNMSGIADWRQHQYYIDKEKYPHGMFNGLLWNTRYYKNIPDRFFITGINIFSFANIKLICPTKITQARVDSLKDSLLDTKEHDIKVEILQKTAMSCIPFHKDDVHSWDSPIPEPVYYEKVKVAPDSSPIKILHLLK